MAEFGNAGAKIRAWQEVHGPNTFPPIRVSDAYRERVQAVATASVAPASDLAPSRLVGPESTEESVRRLNEQYQVERQARAHEALPQKYRTGWALWRDDLWEGAGEIRRSAMAWLDGWAPGDGECVVAGAGERFGLGLVGASGCGKSLLAGCLAWEFLNRFPYRKVRWQNVVRLFTAFRSAYQSRDGLTDNDLIEQVTDCDLLVLNDLAAERPSAMVLERLYEILEIIDEQRSPRLILTSNISGESLVTHFSAGGSSEGAHGGGDTPEDRRSAAVRIYSRIAGLCQPLRGFPNKDFRRA